MIKLPFYDEIRIDKKDPESWKATIENLKFGTIPVYFFLNELEEEMQEQFISLFFNVVNEKKFNLFFPYPIYIVSSTIKRYGKKNIIFKSKKDLPVFFKKDLQKLKARELDALKKILFNAERVGNIDEFKKLKFIKENALKQKKLFNLTNEFNFFQNILDETTDKEI